MQAMIFAAGKGTRLKELTKTTPKPLIEVGGKTLLEHTVLKLKDVGVTEITVNVHYLAEQIIEFFNTNNFGVKVNISHEEEKLLDTGGGLLFAKKYFDMNKPIIIHNSDIISDIELQEMISFHNEFSPLATLAVRNRDSSRKLVFDQRMQLSGRIDKRINVANVKPKYMTRKVCCHTFELGFSGIHIIEPQIFKLLEKYAKKNSNTFSITDFYLQYSKKEAFIGYTHNYGKWADIGSIPMVELYNKGMF